MRGRKTCGLAVLLAVALLLSGWALAAESWTCPNCAQQNSGNFCSNCGTPKPGASDEAGDFLLSWNGFTVEQKSVETNTSSDGSVDLYLHVHVKNGSNRSIWLDADDVTINGVPVTGSGKPGIAPGEEMDVTIYFWPGEDDEAGKEAICNPDTMTMNLNIKDSDTYEDLYEKIVTLSLYMLPSMTPMPTVRATPKPTVRPTTKPVVSYYALVKGDEGEAVRRMQIELIRLGYLAGNADGKFGNQTQEAVREFAKANGLYSNDIATPEMQQVLFSSSAKAYQEPWVPLVIPYPSTGQWQKVSGNKLNFRFQVKNESRTRTIKTFEVRVYALNAWGERIYGERTYYYHTNSKKVAPGKTVYTEYITVPDRSEIAKLYACVSRVVFTDGTIRENEEVNDYSDSWNINF